MQTPWGKSSQSRPDGLGCPRRGLLASQGSKGALLSPRGGGVGGMEKTEQLPIRHWAGMQLTRLVVAKVILEILKYLLFYFS